MSLKIRMSRAGAKKRPFFHIVVADSRSPRDGRFIEKVGHYNPMLDHGHKDRIKLEIDRVKHWLSVGALPSERVARFLGAAEVIAMPKIPNRPKKSAPRKKTVERMSGGAAGAAAAPAAEAPKAG
jgi:small subunit ribosomal protein S16